MTPVTKQKKKIPSILASDEKFAHKNENPVQNKKMKTPIN